VEVEDANVGEIAIRGSSVMATYFAEPKHRSPSGKTRITGEWLLTGDLGYIRDGRLFVVGRDVDRFDGPDGRSIYPEEIEHLVNSVDGVRPGCVVAFDAGNDRWRLVVAAETQPGAESAAIERAISSQLFKAFRIEPDEILLLSPRSIPRSPNGKVRRHLVRMFYEQSILDRVEREDEFDGLRRMWQRARHEAQKLVVQIFRREN
jgi:acyl-CoA synthetase (AMP-forming)/AMP-acid ligase II